MHRNYLPVNVALSCTAATRLHYICTAVQSFFLCSSNNTSYKGGLVIYLSTQNKGKGLDHLDKMMGERLVGLIILLWMTSRVTGQEDLLNNFVQDVVSTFNLTLPTVLYDSDEPPQICYENTPERRVLCLLSTEEEQKISIDHDETGMYVLGSNVLT